MSLDDLPPEIIFHILCFLDPVDIIHLRLTCQTLFELTVKRSVWTDAYWSFARRNQIHSGTYDPQSMSIGQLEDLITTPSRFISRLLSAGAAVPSSNTSIPNISPTCTRIILIDRLQPPYRVGFVPGGRFLIVEAPSRDIHADLVFTVIDLEPPSGEYAVLRRWTCPGVNWECTLMQLGSHDINHKLSFVMAPRARYVNSILGTNLTIFYVSRDASQSAEEEATITNGQLKRYTLLSSTIIREPGQHLQSYSLYDGLFIFSYTDQNGDQHIVVWDFLADKAVVWEIPDHLQSPLTIHNGHIAMMVRLTLRGWKIPDLTAVKKGTVLRLENHPLAFNIVFRSHRARYHCRGSATWYGSTNNAYGSQIFDMIEITAQFDLGEPRRHTLLAWSFTDQPISRGDVSKSNQANPDSSSEPIPSVSYIPTSNVPTKLGEEDEDEDEDNVDYYSRMMQDAVTFVNPFTICEDHIIRILQDRNGGIYAHVTPVLSRKPTAGDDKDESDVEEVAPEPPRGVLVNLKVNDRFFRSAKFDVVSGRLAYILRDDNSIVVTDYNSRRPPQ